MHLLFSVTIFSGTCQSQADSPNGSSGGDAVMKWETAVYNYPFQHWTPPELVLSL